MTEDRTMHRAGGLLRASEVLAVAALAAIVLVSLVFMMSMVSSGG